MTTIPKFVAVTAAAVLLTAASASAQEIRMTATLSPGEETPAPGLLSGAVGAAEVGLSAVGCVTSISIRNILGDGKLNFHSTGPWIDGSDAQGPHGR